MEHLRRWGLADTTARRRTAARRLVAAGHVLRVAVRAPHHGFPGAFGLTTERDERFAKAGQQVPQPVVEDLLRAHVRGQPGVDLRLGHAVTGLSQRDDTVTVAVRDGHGSSYQITARYLIGCDGAAGVVREHIGARYVGHADPRPNFNVVFRAPSLDTHLGPAVQYWVLGAAVPGLLGRLDLRGTWWAILPGIDAGYGEAHAAELITGLAGGPVQLELLASDPWTARMLVADRFTGGRVFLAGESAHVNPPWGGHGFNTSVGDAVNVAWKIAAVEQGWAPAGLLASYEPERRAVIEETVASAAANLRSLARDLPPDERAIQAAKRSEFHSLGLVLGYSYAGSPVIQPAAAPSGAAPSGAARDVSTYIPDAAPGARLPHMWLADGASLYDRLGAGFTLLGPAGPGDPAVAALQDRARHRGIPLKVLGVPPGYPWGQEFLLVRPDQHIAWRARDAAQIDLGLVTGHGITSDPGGPGRNRTEETV